MSLADTRLAGFRIKLVRPTLQYRVKSLKLRGVFAPHQYSYPRIILALLNEFTSEFFVTLYISYY